MATNAPNPPPNAAAIALVMLGSPAESQAQVNAVHTEMVAINNPDINLDIPTPITVGKRQNILKHRLHSLRMSR